MVARSAYAQLRYISLLLIATVSKWSASIYLAPPVLTLFADVLAAVYVLMVIAFEPLLWFTGVC